MMPENLTDVIRCCEQERESFRRASTTQSPCCIELFRRAFAGTQDAWAALWRIFEPQMRAQIPTRQLIEPDVVLQEAMLKFFRSAPAYPGLLATSELGPIIAFLNRNIKWAFLEQYRAARKRQMDVPIEEASFAIPGTAPTRVVDTVEENMLLEKVRQRGQALFAAGDGQEHAIFHEMSVSPLKPREILAAHPDLFQDIRQVNNAIKRVRRKLVSDDDTCKLLGRSADSAGGKRRKIDSDALLEIRGENEQQSEYAMDRPCHLDEDILLDYLLESASDDVRVVIERSPDCLLHVQRLRNELSHLQHIFYRSACPDEETLIAYQERRASGSEYLLLRKHVAHCPLCQDELALLAEMDALASERGVTRRLRQMIEAIFQPPLALALKGSNLLHYQTPDVPHLAINLRISVRTARGTSRTWTLRGELRTHEGQKVGDVLQAVSLRPDDYPEQSAYQGEIQADSSFVLSGLPAGTFRLHLITEDDEIVIPHLVIGDE